MVSSSGIESMAQMVNEELSATRAPAQDLPPFLTTIESKTRPGLSAICLTSNIISRLGEAGIDTGALPDGSENSVTRMVRIIVEELIKEIQLNMKIMIEIPPGVTVGTAATVPVVSTLPIQGSAIAL